MITVSASKAYKAASTARKAATPVKTLPVTRTLKIKIHDGHMLFVPFAWEKRAELTEAIPARWHCKRVERYHDEIHQMGS